MSVCDAKNTEKGSFAHENRDIKLNILLKDAKIRLHQEFGQSFHAYMFHLSNK
jgi:hypothetical protein